MFNTFLSTPKIFDPLVGTLNSIEFNVKIHDNILYNFLGIDYSFSIEIIEVIDVLTSKGLSSRRGNRDIENTEKQQQFLQSNQSIQPIKFTQTSRITNA